MSVVEQALRIARESSDLLAIVGPTASGKTELAVALAGALGGEIVSADSVQIYRGFDVGSGKPGVDELAGVAQHLVSALDPLDPVDAALWARLAERAIEDIRARGRVPIVCGGTFLWVKALLFGLADAPAADAEIRERHRSIAARDGRAVLHDCLRAVDPESAGRLHPNDLLRVSRALEVYELSGRALSERQRAHGFAQMRHPARLIAIRRDAEALTRRIGARVASWLARGWLEEVEELLARGYGEARAMRSVGYEQVRSMLEGRLSREELPVAIVRATRVFARRQRTWLTRANVSWLG